MGVLNGLALDCIDRRVLGDDVDIVITAIDESNSRIEPKKIIRAIEASGGKGLVAMVGVQSNQFPHAVDIARPLLSADVPVCIGGFHVSGCLAMLPEIPPEIREAQDLGISIFAGESEGRLEALLRDAYRGELKPIYNFLPDPPSLEGSPTPVVPPSNGTGNISSRMSFDSGRGCPFECSFCTVINVQGRKSRCRTTDDIEKVLRGNPSPGVKRFFITDDNFARNKNWEAIFDRVIKLKEEEGLEFKFIIQVDALSHLIPNFVEKAGLAGVNRVFIGLESVNPENLMAAKKSQNKIVEYRTMLQAWKNVGVVTCCGYIIGFPGDTPERVMRDIEIIKRELPVDLIEFFCLTPLPGSEDHRSLSATGAWMDPDLNHYDVEHVTTEHPLMAREDYYNTYRRAWDAYYTPEHVETVMRRAVACGIKPRKLQKLLFWFRACQSIEGVHPPQGGLFRRKYRKDRRPGLPVENPLVFYSRYLWEIITKHARLLRLLYKYKRIRSRVESDPRKREYVDLALTPAVDEDVDTLEMFNSFESGEAAPEKMRLKAVESPTP
jgi:hypothetical protein